mgnify:CR=1 FL=1
MRHLREFKLFESEKTIDSICQEYGIKDYTINDDGSIDTNRFTLYQTNLDKLPLRFNKVSRSFLCYHNQLRSLEGCPKFVGWDFYCNNNKLTSLEGCPASVGNIFYCNDNLLSSLEGCPESINKHFGCHNNKLTSLEGCPKFVGGNFECDNNQIRDFKGFPEYFGGRLLIDNNPVHNIYKLFNDPSKITLFNEYDIIRGNEIILDRLNDFLNEVGKPEVSEVAEYICI